MLLLQHKKLNITIHKFFQAIYKAASSEANKNNLVNGQLLTEKQDKLFDKCIRTGYIIDTQPLFCLGGPMDPTSTVLAQLEKKYLETTDMSLLDFMIGVAMNVFDGASDPRFTDYFVSNFDFVDATDVVAYYNNPLVQLWNA